MYREVVRGPPNTPECTHGSGQRASNTSGCPGQSSKNPRCTLRTLRVMDLLGVLPHCCGGSWQSGHRACSPEHLRTPGTPSLQTRCPHCSRPTSSRGQVSPGDGCCIRRWQQSPQHTSASQRRPHQLRQWRAQRQTLGWLQREVCSRQDSAAE